MQADRGLETKYNIGLFNLNGFSCLIYSLLNFDLVLFLFNHF
jgi:hypothetical protein